MELRRHLSIAGVVLSLIQSTSSLCAEQAVDSSSSQLEEVVVTAQKRSENVNDVPLSITTATAGDLVKLGITSPDQLEKLVPGFTYQKSAYGVPVYYIRGIGFYDTTTGVTPAVAVYVDQIGLPFLAMTRGDSLDVERIEVLKGPQGTLFGQNSTGGAINYIAAKPTTTPEAGISLDYGRFNAAALEGYVSGPLADTLSARVAIRAEQQGDWQESYTRDAGLGAKHFLSGRLLLDWIPADNLRFELNINGWRDTSDTEAPQLIQVAFQVPAPNGYPPAIAALTNYPLAPHNTRAADWDPGTDFARDDNFYQASLHAEWQIQSDLTLTSLTSYADDHTTSETEADGTAYLDAISAPHVVLTSLSQELRLAGELGAGRYKWMVGGNYSRDKADENQYFPLGNSNSLLLGMHYDGALNVNDQAIKTKAGFGSFSTKVTDTVTAEASARYTDSQRKFVGCLADPGNGELATAFTVLAGFLAGAPRPIGPGQCVTTDPTRDFQPGLVRNNLDEDNASWRASLNWEPNSNSLLYATLSKGYKAGNYATVPGLSPAQFAPVTQESLLAYEVGTKLTLIDRTLQLNSAVFYYDYKDKQLLGYYNDPLFGPLPRPVNIPKSRITGAEIDLQWNPFRGLRIKGGLTYVDSKVLENPTIPIDPYGNPTNFIGEAFPNTPRWQGVMDAEYSIPINANVSGYVGSTFSYRSSSNAAFGDTPMFVLNAHGLLDLRLGVESKRWRAELYGRNVTDKYYWTNVQHVTDTVTRYAGMPATFGIFTSYKF